MMCHCSNYNVNVCMQVCNGWQYSSTLVVAVVVVSVVVVLVVVTMMTEPELLAGDAQVHPLALA